LRSRWRRGQVACWIIVQRDCGLAGDLVRDNYTTSDLTPLSFPRLAERSLFAERIA
jgi:hypothetical protein